MATVAKIKCGSCKRVFDYYFNLRTDDIIICPYCYKPMESQSAQDVLQAMGAFSDINMEMRRYSADRGDPLFQIDLLEIGE